jgi:hypothetical protein
LNVDALSVPSAMIGSKGTTLEMPPKTHKHARLSAVRARYAKTHVFTTIEWVRVKG